MHSSGFCLVLQMLGCCARVLEGIIANKNVVSSCPGDKRVTCWVDTFSVRRHPVTGKLEGNSLSQVHTRSAGLVTIIFILQRLDLEVCSISFLYNGIVDMSMELMCSYDDPRHRVSCIHHPSHGLKFDTPAPLHAC